MTLIAAFKCSDGFVLCADSQESVGQYRVSRQKLVPVPLAGTNFEIAVAGSGNDGTLIDSFVQRLQDNLLGFQGTTLSDLRKSIGSELLDFRKNEMAGYSAKQKQMRFMIGARSIAPPDSVAWVTSASRLTPIGRYALVGWEDYRYEDVLKRLYRENIPIGQGIFLGVHLMSLAEQTSNNIKAPVSVATLNDHGLQILPQKKVDDMQDRVKLFSSQFDGLFLSCPDTGLQPQQFIKVLKDFVDTVIQLRREYTEETIQGMLDQGLDKISDSFNLIPLGTTVVLTPNADQIAKSQQMMEDLAKAIKEQGKGEQEKERLLSNLNKLKSAFIQHLKHVEDRSRNEPPTEEVQRTALIATGELMRASLMGPYKVSAAAVRAINQITTLIRSDLGFGEVGNLKVYLVAVDACFDVVSKETSTS